MSNKKRRNSDVSDDDMEVSAGYESDEERGLRVDDEIYIPPPPRIMGANNVDAPRLMMKKIVNRNFKSYAGESILGPFHECFSCIVGPNGAGKSNVIDSVLFVFGYRATKIRSKKISVLIHNSSAHPAINSCTVSVHFHKIIDKSNDDHEVVPGSEFIISRTAFKDNSSYYEYNSKKVQFKEIAKVLRSEGVDLDHNRFLILQGEVEQIALMKPKAQNEHETGMLEYIEDIIGTARFKEPLEQLSNKVEALNEIKTEKYNRLRAVGKERETLIQPMQEAVDYLKLENTIIKFKHQLNHCIRYKATQDLASKEEDKKNLDNDYNTLMQEMETVKQCIKDKTQELTDKSKTWETLELKKNQLNEKFEKIRKKDESLHAELVQIHKRKKNNSNLIATENTKLDELKIVPDKNKEQIRIDECELEEKTKTLEIEESAFTAVMIGLKARTAPLVSQRTILENKLLIIRKGVDEKKEIYDVTKSNLKLYASIEQTERDKLKDLEETLTKNLNTLNQRREQLKSLDKKIPSTEKSLNGTSNELQVVKQKAIETNGKLKNLRSIFEEKKSNMQANKSRNRVHGVLMEEKRNGRIPGIFGRLGDLGGIDSKYDVAISTACGSLDNMVVDTVSSAESCINHLRATNVGRATFIPLEKQQRFVKKCSEKIQTPENVPRLFDLIQGADSRVLPAFYYALQDTLVARDLDQALRVAYGPRRYRVVTLKGELIELSGTMSGGGRTMCQGRMGQRVVVEENPDVLNELQSRLDSVYEESLGLREKQQSLENQVDTLSKAMKDMVVDRNRFRIEIKTLEEQEPSLQKQLIDQKKKVEETLSNPDEIKRLENLLQKAEGQYNSAKKDLTIIENDISSVNKEIDEISGNQLKTKQKIIDGLHKDIDELGKNICQLQVGIKTAMRDEKKTLQRLETLQANVERDEKRLQDIEEDKVRLEQACKIVMDELESIGKELQGEGGIVGDLRKELNDLNNREAKMKALQIDLDEKVQNSNKVLKDLRDDILLYTKKIQSSKLQYIPDETVEELVELPDEEVQELHYDSIKNNLQRAESRLPNETPNLQIIDDYREKNNLYLKRVEDLELITNKRNQMRDIFEATRRRRIQEFSAGFDKINTKLKEMYQMIAEYGDAALELVDTLDPFNEGISFFVRPPHKSWKNISNLSGGEKTLSSLALVFALHHYKPTPLYFMDEIDAALDFKNVSIIAHYIKQWTKNAQFIVISHASNMYEFGDVLIGLYKHSDCTRIIPLDVQQFCKDHGIATPVIEHTQPSQQFSSICTTNVVSQPIQDTSRIPNILEVTEPTTQTLNETRDKRTSSDVLMNNPKKRNVEIPSSEDNTLLPQEMLPEVVLVPLNPSLLKKTTLKLNPKIVLTPIDMEQRNLERQSSLESLSSRRRSPRLSSTPSRETKEPNKKKKRIK